MHLCRSRPYTGHIVFHCKSFNGRQADPVQVLYTQAIHTALAETDKLAVVSLPPLAPLPPPPLPGNECQKVTGMREVVRKGDITLDHVAVGLCIQWFGSLLNLRLFIFRLSTIILFLEEREQCRHSHIHPRRDRDREKDGGNCIGGKVWTDLRATCRVHEVRVAFCIKGVRSPSAENAGLPLYHGVHYSSNRPPVFIVKIDLRTPCRFP